MTAIPVERQASSFRMPGDRTSKHYSAGGEIARHSDSVEELAFHYGQGYDSYLVIEPGRDYFWSKSGSGYIAFTERGKYFHVVGGVLAPMEDRAALLADFVHFARTTRGGKIVAFYNIMREDIPLFAAGFEITKCGEEPIVDLVRTTWSGKQYEWLRRQEHFCTRQGVECIEVPAGPGLGGFADELRAVSSEHLDGTPHGKEMRYFVGSFDPETLGRRRVFLARRDGRVEGFIVCNPCLGGRMWAIETYRRREDSTRGVIPFTMLQAMRRMKAEGVRQVSLSQVPGLRAEEGHPGGSWLLRLGQILWWRHLNWLYDMHGIYHYKSRFRPDFRNMYIAAQPRLTLMAIKSFFDTWGMFDISLGRIRDNRARKQRKAQARKTLANPGHPGGDNGDARSGGKPEAGRPAKLAGKGRAPERSPAGVGTDEGPAGG